MAESHAQLESAQRYAAGSLSAADAATFEDHLVGCEQCQTEVRLTVGVRRLARDLQEHGAKSTVSRGQVFGAVALLAAGLVIFALLPRGVGAKLAALGHVADPPAYVGMSVRDARGLADSLFGEAMTAYVARRYADAAAGLRRALAAGVDTVPATFFMASAELMSGRAREAADAYGRVIAAGSVASAYLPEAHLYRARALLLLGRGAEALSELSAVSRDSDRGAAAAALADSVSQVLRR